jgi:hypothetical protein
VKTVRVTGGSGHGTVVQRIQTDSNSDIYSALDVGNRQPNRRRDRGLSASTPAKPAKEATKGQTYMDQRHQNQPKHYAIKALAETGFKNLSSDKIIDENTSDDEPEVGLERWNPQYMVPTTHGRGWQMLPHTSSRN